MSHDTSTQMAHATSGSATTTEQSAGPSLPPPGTLRLRAQRTDSGRHIQWAEDVVDNEGMGKKSSKVCCIYHKPRVAGESSDESSSDSSSDSDSDLDDGAARPSSNGRGRGHKHQGHGHDGDDGKGGDAKGKGKAKKRMPSPNAYEKMPKYNTQK